MTSTLASGSDSEFGETIKAKHTKSIPPLVKELLNDLSNIRRVALTESPHLLPLLAPSLIEAEVHVRQLWSNQIQM